jgi:hypothetical protein
MWFAWMGAGKEQPLTETEIVDVTTGKQRLLLPLEVSQFGWSKDARYVSLHARDTESRLPPDFVSYQKAAVWDLEPAAPRQVPLGAPPGGPAFSWRRANERFSSDGRLFTVFGFAPRDPKAPWREVDWYLVRWELPGGRLMCACQLVDASLSRHDRFLLGPHGDRLARLSGGAGVPGPRTGQGLELELWEIKPDGASTRLWGESAAWAEVRADLSTIFALPYVQLEFTPDGRRLVLIGETETRIWDLVVPGPPMILRGKRGNPTALALSPDQRRFLMVTTPESTEQGTPGRPELHVWDLTNGQELLAAPIPLRSGHSVRGGWTSFDGRQLRFIGGTREQQWALVLDGTPR